MTPKAGNFGKIPNMSQLEMLPQPKKTFLPHLISLSTWVAWGCLKRSRADPERALTRSSY